MQRFQLAREEIGLKPQSLARVTLAENECLRVVHRLIEEYVQSASLHHLRGPNSVNGISRQIVKA